VSNLIELQYGYFWSAYFTNWVRYWAWKTITVDKSCLVMLHKPLCWLSYFNRKTVGSSFLLPGKFIHNW